MAELHHIREIDGAVKKLGENENISEALITAIDLGTGVAAARVSLPREMFYRRSRSSPALMWGMTVTS